MDKITNDKYCKLVKVKIQKKNIAMCLPLLTVENWIN